jgi:hypothetical protein
MSPLKWITEHPPNQGRARQLFLLTDGEISNVTEVLDLCRLMATSTRIFSFGLGKSPSRSLVKGLARATNGRFAFIPPNSSVDIYVGEQLQKALQPCLTNIQVKWNLGVNVQNAPKQIPPVYLNDRLIVYALTNDKNIPFDHNSSVELQIGSDNRSIGVARVNQIPNVPDNETIARLAAKALILELQHAKLPSTIKPSTGSTQARFQDMATSNEVKMEVVPDKQTTQQRIIELSLKYNILSPHTAFVGIEKRTNASNAGIVLREVPIEISADDQHLMGSFARSSFGGAMRRRKVMNFTPLKPSLSRPMASSARMPQLYDSSYTTLVGTEEYIHPNAYCADALIDSLLTEQCITLSASIPQSSVDHFSSDDAELESRLSSLRSYGEKQPQSEPVWPSTNQDIVRYLINKQKFDGLWNGDDNIINNLTGKSLCVFRSTTANINEEILASVIVIIMLETKFAGFSSLWHGVVQKARKQIDDLLKKDSKTIDALIEDIRKQL